MPCLHDDGFCEPTILTPFTIVLFPEEQCLFYQSILPLDACLNLTTVTGLKPNTFLSNRTSTTSSDTPYHDTESQFRLSRVEIFPESKMFCNKPTPLYTTQNPDLFITYKESFNMHTGT